LYRLEAFMYKETKILEEKLERATKVEIGRLSQQIIKDPELRRMLATPMEEIPQYNYLYSSGLRHLGQHSLFDAIKFMLEYEHRNNLYFSKIGNNFTGFIVYEDNGQVINNVKMASFKDDRKQANPILAKDLIEFVLDMASQREYIEWHVDPKNKKAIQEYDALLNRKKLNWKSLKDGQMIKYSVQGFKS
jgi:hypothetical protein